MKMEKSFEQMILDWEDSFGNMVTIHDNNYNIIAANSSAKKLLKTSSAEILKKKCYENYHGSNTPPKECPSCDCLKSGKPSIVEIFEPHLNMHLEIKALPLFNSDNSTKGVIHIVKDITIHKKMENEILYRMKELEAFYDMAINRELKMAELKMENEKLRNNN
ncbi:MAG: PAS domain-containing protein [Thermodesulfovibrionia bacterium]|nr:PAS domain-containing protein [Thermodesulfovibrionia bacterium]